MSAAARARQPVDPEARSWTGSGRIESGADVGRVLAEVRAAGQRRDRTAGSRVVDRAEDVALTVPDAARVLAVVPELEPLLPWPGGIRRGATVAAVGGGSLLLTLLAEPMSQGAWAAVVGIPDLSGVPAAEYGIDLARLALAPRPGERWAEAVAVLIDGLDIVVVGTPADVPAGTARALMARARQRGCVLIPSQPWPGCEVTLRVVERRWLGLGHGRGRLRLQQATLEAAGRGRAARPRQVSTTFPPPSIVERVGPLPGQIPGLPIERLLDPDRVIEATPAPARPRLVPPPSPPDPWRDLFRNLPPARTNHRAG